VVTNTNLYAKTGFYEEPFLTDGVCTHFSKWNNEPKWAAYCKEFATSDTCLNVDVYGHQGGRSVAYASGIDCEGGTLIHSEDSTHTQQECATLCYEKYGEGDRSVIADFFTLTTDGSSHCACYNGLCADTGTGAAFDVYSIENICYWTSATPVYTASDCANSAETTINGGLTEPTTSLTFAANWDEALCHF
jgi:acetyltransferase-like isoleucine patch superfamily enzyme